MNDPEQGAFDDMHFRRLEQENKRLKSQVAELQKRLAYYETPPPPFEECHCAHIFTQEGICIRCGEDAEEWDAGCVEEIIRDLEYADHARNEALALAQQTMTDLQEMSERMRATVAAWKYPRPRPPLPPVDQEIGL